MTEEELRKQATSTVEWENTPLQDRPQFVHAYIVGAKSSESRIEKLEKEITELKQAKAIAQLNLDNSRLSIENERLHKENAELKEIKELFSRLNKEQSEAILELKMRIEEMESSSKHWDEIHRGSKIMGLDIANELKTQKQLVRAKAIIKEMLSILPKENIEGIYEIAEEAEQFLRELEE